MQDVKVAVFGAKRRLRDALAFLSGVPSDEAVNRAIDAAAAAQGALAAELADREAARVRVDQARVIEAHTGATDRTGRGRSPVTLPGYRRGRPPANKGLKLPATPPSVEEITAMIRTCGDNPHGMRMRALILVLWRSGLRISEALALTEPDLNREDSSIYVRRGKGGKSRTVGIDEWVWRQLEPWLSFRQTLPVGALFCVIVGPTAGKAWAAPDVRKQIRVLAAAAGVRRRVAPHQFRHAHAVQMLGEGINVFLIQKQLDHGNLAITTNYFAGLPQSKVVEAVRSRPVPQISALAEIAPARKELVEHV